MHDVAGIPTFGSAPPHFCTVMLQLVVFLGEVFVCIRISRLSSARSFLLNPV